MRKFLPLLLLVVVDSLPLVAQQTQAPAASPAVSPSQALPADAASKEQVLKLFDMLQVRKNMAVMMEAMKQQAKNVAEQTLRQNVPNPTPEQRKATEAMINGIMDDTMKAMPFEEILNALVPIYQRHLTKDDIEAISGFYASPAGQKFLREQPQMVRESMEAIGPLQQRMIDTVMKNSSQRVQQMIDAEKAEKEKSSGKPATTTSDTPKKQ